MQVENHKYEESIIDQMGKVADALHRKCYSSAPSWFSANFELYAEELERISATIIQYTAQNRLIQFTSAKDLYESMV